MRKPGPNCQIVGCLFRRDSPRGASSGRADGRRPPRRRSAQRSHRPIGFTPNGPPRRGRAKVASSIPARTSSGFWRAGCRAGHRTRFLGISDEPARWSIFTGTMASVPTLSSPRHNLPPSEGPLKVAATRCMRRSCVELLESCNNTERLRVIPRHQCASLRRGDAWRHVALRTNIRYGSALNRFKKSRPPPQPLLSANSTDRRHAASVTWSQPGSRQAENA